jgi:hypothetical protein
MALILQQGVEHQSYPTYQPRHTSSDTSLSLPAPAIRQASALRKAHSYGYHAVQSYEIFSLFVEAFLFSTAQRLAQVVHSCLGITIPLSLTLRFSSLRLTVLTLIDIVFCTLYPR